jgi:hypothetical protein
MTESAHPVKTIDATPSRAEPATLHYCPEFFCSLLQFARLVELQVSRFETGADIGRFLNCGRRGFLDRCRCFIARSIWSAGTEED